jgi:toxin ParE1/3/4
MKPYSLTPGAEVDLESIGRSIALDSPDVSEKVVTEIRAAMRRLSEYPRIGRARSDIGDADLRVWVVFSYIIVYRASTRPLEIVRIIHGARDLAEALGVRVARKKSRSNGGARKRRQ